MGFMMKTWNVLPTVSAVALLTTALPLAANAADGDKDLLTVYGKANVSLQRNDEGGKTTNELESNASRFGVKGKQALESGLTAFYKFEWDVDLTDNAKGDNIKSRNQYVGLAGDFGEVMVGRRDTVLKSSQGNTDVFSDYDGDIKALFEGENRLSNSVTYFSPSFSNFKVGVSYILSEDENVDDGVSASLMYGDEDLKATPYYFAIAADQDVDGWDVIRGTASTAFNKTQVSLMLQTQESSMDSSIQGDGYMLSVAHPFGALKLKAQFQSMDYDGFDTARSYSVGADYKLAKSTKVYTWVTHRTLATAEPNEDYIALGIEHKFSW
ncbi:porin [Idiomarina tyrosinivorans]|uniref:Porin n=2 Tax=Idiomarina tyrosinivorans TaxID=1445662 RepID=A0A432ZSB7_9GAMM|nr:porin [Idiomarina tyrosinivorans]